MTLQIWIKHLNLSSCAKGLGSEYQVRVLEIEFNDHPQLGNLRLDFRDGTGKASPTIVIAGENGCGKTTILRALSELGTPRFPRPHHLNARVLLEVSARDEEASLIRIFSRSTPVESTYPLSQATSSVPSPAATASPAYTVAGNAPLILELALQAPESRTFRAIDVQLPPGSRVSAASVPTFLLDLEQGQRDPDDGDQRNPPLSDRAGTDLKTRMRQMLIRLAQQDGEDLSVWVFKHPKEAPPEWISARRLRPFRKAFAYMFPSKQLGRVEFREQGLIEFEEHERVMPIEKLSSGEQQIVHRGAFVLSNENSRNGLLLIDEPELSLHPDWQRKILGFFQRLIESENNAQLIVATHSPFVVHEQTSAKVIIIRKNTDTGFPEVEQENPMYPEPGPLRVVKALNLDHLLSEDSAKTFVLVEGETDERIIKAAWRVLRQGRPCPFRIVAAGGDTDIQRTLNTSPFFGKKVIGLFDFDQGFNRWNAVGRSKNGNEGTKNGRFLETVTDDSKGRLKVGQEVEGWAMLLPVPDFMRDRAGSQFRGDSELSIEFMFRQTDHLPHMISETAIPGDGVRRSMKDGRKTEFAAHVETFEDPRQFAAFEPLFKAIEEIHWQKTERQSASR
ncbi:MAG TPA: AAA family ATPase [Aurantimonas sp.]|nr:AAA family ATPase [Aurantimonas sp.]